jgi:curved DNA-binding protein CbpA
MFKEIGEAYQILSDSDTRAYYDKVGRAGMNQPESAMEDPQEMFSKLFGGGEYQLDSRSVRFPPLLRLLLNSRSIREKQLERTQGWVLRSSEPERLSHCHLFSSHHLLLESNNGHPGRIRA